MTRRLVCFTLLAALAGCGGDGVPPSGDVDGGGVADAAGPPDARPPALHDSLPLGAISFFKTVTCPTGWVPFTAGVGRFFVPTVGTTLPGTAHGTPLASGEDRVHTHEVAASVSTGSVSYVGVAGGGNGGVSPSGTYGFQAITAPASSGLPYVQLLVCFKSAPPMAGTTPVPTGTMLFFRSQCPNGWSQAPTTQGRMLVGVPQAAPPNVWFGGAPLASDEARRHAHSAGGSVDLGQHGIALASGCCGGGYARGGSYSYSLTSSETVLDLPYVELLQCRKD